MQVDIEGAEYDFLEGYTRSGIEIPATQLQVIFTVMSWLSQDEVTHVNSVNMLNASLRGWHHLSVNSTADYFLKIALFGVG